MAGDDIHLADVIEALAVAMPERPAIVQGERRTSWRDFDERSGGIAAALLDAGLERGDRVAIYLRNCPEYLETHVGALKSSFVPVNTNYRYVDDELVHLWQDADAAAVIFHGSFTSVIERIRLRCGLVRAWIWVDDGSDPCPDWATPYEEAVRTPPRPAPWPRSRDDLVFIYTGGTTGLPKGVMWGQEMYAANVDAADGDLTAFAERRAETNPRTILPAAPLMHGTGCAAAFGTLVRGGTVVLLPAGGFDPIALWDAVERDHVGSIALVGDAFAHPMIEALDEHPDRWDLSSLRGMISAGVMFSAPVKERLLAHLPGLRLVDQFGSSENGNAGASVSVSEGTAATGSFQPVPGVRVIDELGNDVEPGSGAIGVLAIPGGARGYHKDPEKSARTWPVIDGQRYTVAGDYATVEADGTVRLLGRGSVCINSGGEKIYPEEVEEALKSHEAVRDAIVVGIPDARFGEVVSAAVELRDDVAVEHLIEHVRGLLAGYKVPRHIVPVDSIGRAPNGKADYAATREVVTAAIGA